MEIRVNSKAIITENDNIKFYDNGDFHFGYYQDSKNDDRFRRDNLSDLIVKKMLNCVTRQVHGKTQENTKKDIFFGIKISSDENMLMQLKRKSLRSWQISVESWNIKNEDFLELKNLIVLYELVTLFSFGINYYAKNLFSNSRYIAPLRASAERYYRIQHLAIDEVDPNGKNLPFFLDSLSEKQIQDFQAWTNENFGFVVNIYKIEGHYSIKLSHDDNKSINLSDMGFGYSQILPIITQLWISASRYDGSRSSASKIMEKIIVIEQPELHLHPEFQAKFADVIVSTIRSAEKNNIKLRIVIETHSDIIVNRLGDNILNNKISHEEINLVIFNKRSEVQPTEISFANYDEEGNLLNWPLGFFQPTTKFGSV